MQKKYQQLKNDLLSELVLGKRLPGTILPSEPDMVRSYGLSRGVIRHAIDCLLKEGFLEKNRNGRNVICGIPAPNAAKKILLVVRNMNSVLPDIYRMLYEALLLKCCFEGISLFCYSEGTLPEFAEKKRDYNAILGLGICRFPKMRTLTDRRILLDDFSEGSIPCIAVDNFSGGEMVAEHLLKCGYRKPLFLTLADQESYLPYLKRKEGFCSRMEEAGIKVSCRYASSSSALSALAALQSWKELKKADSLFVVHDYFAVNTCYALRKMEISIPRDLAVAGFDGLPSATYLSPSLTTVAQPVNGIAEKALELALSGEKPTGNILLPPELIIRESTAEKV